MLVGLAIEMMPQSTTLTPAIDFTLYLIFRRCKGID